MKSNVVNNTYGDMVWKVVQRRMMLGGYRLANLIIKIYDGGIEKEMLRRKWERMKRFANEIHK